MEFIITGRIKPAVRMTRKGKWVDPEALEYLASQQAIAWQFREQCPEMLPARTPLVVTIEIETPKPFTGDIDNQIKAVIDSAQGIVFKNDCWISEIHACRRRAKEYKAKVSISTKEQT